MCVVDINSRVLSRCALGIARRGETTHSGVDVNNTHPSMINPLNQPFPNFSFNRGHNLSCDWLFMQQVFLGHPLPPCGVVTKDTWAWYLVPLEWTEARMIKDGDKKILLTAMTQTKLLSLLNKWMISGLGVKLSQHTSFSLILLIGIFRSVMIIHWDKCHRTLLINLIISPHCFR